MGADLLIVSIAFRVPDGNDQATIGRAIAEQMERAKKDLEAYEPEEMMEHLTPQPDSVEEAKKILRESLEYVREAAMEHRRDACWIGGGRNILILLAGGPSWGDSPSVLYDHISNLQHFYRDPRHSEAGADPGGQGDGAFLCWGSDKAATQADMLDQIEGYCCNEFENRRLQSVRRRDGEQFGIEIRARLVRMPVETIEERDRLIQSP